MKSFRALGVTKPISMEPWRFIGRVLMSVLRFRPSTEVYWVLPLITCVKVIPIAFASKRMRPGSLK